MSNYITISGASIWVLLGLLALVFIVLVVLGDSYVKAERDKQYYQKRCHKLCREIIILQLSAIRGEENGDRSEK